MIPLSDFMPARRFPVVNITLIVACFSVWLFYQLSHSTPRSRTPRSTRARSTGPATAPSLGRQLVHRHVHARQLEPHPRQHAVPGDLRQKRRRPARAPPYLLFYIAGDFVATLTQTAMTLLASSDAAAAVPTLGASGAIAAVLGAYVVFYPNGAYSRSSSCSPCASRPGSSWAPGSSTSSSRATSASSPRARTAAAVAFFAHIGGFLFGVLVARLLAGATTRQPASATT